MYDLVFVKCTRNELVAWLESIGEIAFVLFETTFWTPMCTSSSSEDVSLRASTDCGVVAIHLKSEKNNWEMSIFNSGWCISSVRCDWTNRPIVIDRSRLDLAAIGNLVYDFISVMPADYQKIVGRGKELRLKKFVNMLETDNWDLVEHDDMPDEIFAELLGLVAEDGLEFKQLLKERSEEPEGFKLMYPWMVAVNL